MKWFSVVFDDPDMADGPGCSACGLKIGNDGRVFFRPDIDFATEDEAGLVRELAEATQGDVYESWFCPDCRDKIEKAAAE